MLHFSFLHGFFSRDIKAESTQRANKKYIKRRRISLHLADKTKNSFPKQRLRSGLGSDSAPLRSVVASFQEQRQQQQRQQENIASRQAGRQHNNNIGTRIKKDELTDFTISHNFFLETGLCNGVSPPSILWLCGQHLVHNQQ